VEVFPCEGKSWSYYCWFLVCGPFAAEGIMGKESAPSIGWEVSEKSL
jgi:hypothetical protein